MPSRCVGTGRSPSSSRSRPASAGERAGRRRQVVHAAHRLRGRARARRTGRPAGSRHGRPSARADDPDRRRARRARSPRSPSTATSVLVEGAGGVRVTARHRGRHDARLAAALVDRGQVVVVVVVTGLGLGTLNHTELTVGALRAHGLEPAGLVLGIRRGRPRPRRKLQPRRPAPADGPPCAGADPGRGRCVASRRVPVAGSDLGHRRLGGSRREQGVTTVRRRGGLTRQTPAIPGRFAWLTVQLDG